MSSNLTGLPPTRQEPARIIIRYSSLAVAVAGCALGVWKNTEFSKSDAKLRGLSNFNANATVAGISQQWENARVQRNTDLTEMLIGYGIGVLGAAGFTITFLW